MTRNELRRVVFGADYQTVVRGSFLPLFETEDAMDEKDAARSALENSLIEPGQICPHSKGGPYTKEHRCLIVWSPGHVSWDCDECGRHWSVTAPAPAQWFLKWTAPIGEVGWPEAFDTERDAKMAVEILKRFAGWTSVRVEAIPCVYPAPEA